jgi:hypothetical protein
MGITVVSGEVARPCFEDLWAWLPNSAPPPTSVCLSNCGDSTAFSWPPGSVTVHGCIGSLHRESQFNSLPRLDRRTSSWIPFFVNPVPSVHLAPNWRPNTWLPLRPAPPPQFQAISWGRLPRPTSSTPHASKSRSSPDDHRRSPILRFPAAGRACSLDVKLNGVSCHGMTTVTDSWAGGLSTAMSNDPGRPSASGHDAQMRVLSGTSSMISLRPVRSTRSGWVPGSWVQPRKDQVAGKDCPLVTPLVDPERTGEVGPVHRVARPSERCRVERGPVGGTVVHRCHQLWPVGHGAVLHRWRGPGPLQVWAEADRGHPYVNTTVLCPWTSIRSIRCNRTERASTTVSRSRPMRIMSAGLSRCDTWVTAWSMIGPWSRSAVA